MRVPAASVALDGSGRRHAVLHKRLRDMLDGDRQQWSTWLRVHGVAVSRDILVGTSIVCDDSAPSIAVTVVRRDGPGGQVLRDDSDGTLETTTVVIALAVPAGAMPGESCQRTVGLVRRMAAAPGTETPHVVRPEDRWRSRLVAGYTSTSIMSVAPAAVRVLCGT